MVVGPESCGFPCPWGAAANAGVAASQEDPAASTNPTARAAARRLMAEPPTSGRGPSRLSRSRTPAAARRSHTFATVTAERRLRRVDFVPYERRRDAGIRNSHGETSAPRASGTTISSGSLRSNAPSSAEASSSGVCVRVARMP